MATAVRSYRLAFALVSQAARREVWLMIGLALLGSLFAAAGLLVGGKLVALITNERDVPASDLVPWLAGLGTILIGTSLVSTASAELRILLNELVHRQAMDQVLEVTTSAELELFEDSEFHDRVERARENSYTYSWQVVWGLFTFLSTLFSSIAVGLVLLGVAPVLVPIAVLAFIPISLANVRNARALYDMRYALAELDRDRAYHERLLTGRIEAKEVRAFGLADWVRMRHDELFDRRVRNTREVVAKRTWLALIGSTITSVVLVATLAVVMLLALDDRLSVADASVAVVALQQLSSRLRNGSASIGTMVEGVTFLRDFETFRAMLPTESTNSANEQVIDQATPTAMSRVPAAPALIRLQNVAYRYPTADDPTLHDISFTVERGQVVAIVGPNGAGKSTVAKILCGLLPPSSGAVLWDDLDVTQCPAADVRARVAPVFQDFTQFEFPARLVVGFGDLTRLDDREGIIEAARQAGADEFLSALPKGYDTRLSTSFADGTDLSVGQWQRVSIARAFFRDAPLVVMDEPAASLDPRAERDLFERLHELGRDRLVVFISHRFATVRRADVIVMLLDGRVAEIGTHDVLMDQGGMYAELYTMQAEQFG
jgi:ATP-binding cassette subfamily B protein